MPLTVYKRGKIWHYRGSVAGRRLRGSTGAADKETAQRIAANKESAAWKCNLDGPEAVLTFAQAALLYRGAGKATRFLSRIEDHWKDTLVKDITPGAIRQSAVTLYPRVSAATRNRQVIVPTQAVINHAADSELCPRIRVRRFPIATKSKVPADWPWVQAFMAHANPHLGALCCFMFLTGARISEALNVLWRDIDLSAGRATIRQTKIASERNAHLPPVLVAAIANIASNRNPDDPVFRYSSRDTAKPQWRKAIRRAKIKPLSFHSCRHGFATAALRSGIDIITVAKLGGWKSAEHVFKTYGHALDDDTVTNRLTDTDLTQGDSASAEKTSKAKAV